MKRKVFLTFSTVILLLAVIWFKSDMASITKVTDTPTEVGGDKDNGGTASTAAGVLSNELSQKQVLGGASQSETKAKGTAAKWVYKDPVTGKIGTPPPGTPRPELPKELQNALSTSSEGLQEIQSPVGGGGTMVRLNGRFQNAKVGTANSEGKVSVQCLSTVPAQEKSNLSQNLKADPKKEKE